MGILGFIFGRRDSVVVACNVKRFYNKQNRREYWRWEGIDKAGKSVCTDSPPFCASATEAAKIAEGAFPDAEIRIHSAS